MQPVLPQVVAGDVSVNVYEVSTVVRWVTQVYTHENYNQWYLQVLHGLLGFNFPKIEQHTVGAISELLKHLC